jgi:pimeloyl-ACP methyl ester carboxylesterase
MTAALEWYRAMSLDEWADVPAVEISTTYVWGVEDVAVTRAAALACAGYVAADYSFVPLDGRGHWLPEQAPEAIVTAVLDRVARS